MMKPYKGVRFYRDVQENPLYDPEEDDGKTSYSGGASYQNKPECVNAVAVFVEPDPYYDGSGLVKEALVPTFFRDNSPVSIGSVPVSWLRDAEEISLEEAREIHPQLVERVDRAEEDFWGELNQEMEAMWGSP